MTALKELVWSAMESPVAVTVACVVGVFCFSAVACVLLGRAMREPSDMEEPFLFYRRTR